MPEYHYLSLLRLQLAHEYYQSAAFDDLEIRIPLASQRKMQDLGLLYRPSQVGGQLIAEARDDGGTLVATRPIEEEQRLHFFFCLKNALFLSITEGDRPQLGEEIFYLNSQNATSSSAGEEMLAGPLIDPLALKSAAFYQSRQNAAAVWLSISNPLGVSRKLRFDPREGRALVIPQDALPGRYQLQELDASDNPLGNSSAFYFHPEAHSAQALIAFELLLSPPVNLSTPLNYLFNFTARNVVWRYQIYKHPLPNSLGTDPYTSLAVLHTPQGSDPLIPFSSASGSDPVTIESTTAIKLREQTYRQLKLENSGDTVLENLSNPRADKLHEDNGQWISDIKLNLYI